MMTDLIDGFKDRLVPVLRLDVKRLRPNSDLGEVRWFFENIIFQLLSLNTLKILLRWIIWREKSHATIRCWCYRNTSTLQSKVFVRGVVMDQNGDPIEDATLDFQSL